MNNGAYDSVAEDLRENGWLSPEDQKQYVIIENHLWNRWYGILRDTAIFGKLNSDYVLQVLDGLKKGAVV
jgi:hypothetical protein